MRSRLWVDTDRRPSSRTTRGRCRMRQAMFSGASCRWRSGTLARWRDWRAGSIEYRSRSACAARLRRVLDRLESRAQVLARGQVADRAPPPRDDAELGGARRRRLRCRTGRMSPKCEAQVAGNRANDRRLPPRRAEERQHLPDAARTRRRRGDRSASHEFFALETAVRTFMPAPYARDPGGSAFPANGGAGAVKRRREPNERRSVRLFDAPAAAFARTFQRRFCSSCSLLILLPPFVFLFRCSWWKLSSRSAARRRR